MRRERVIEGHRVTLDLAPQVLRLDAPADGRYDEPVLSPTPNLRETFVSASVLGHKAKCLDDAIMATVELAAQEGLGTFPSKARMLERWAQASLRAGAPLPISALLLAACELGDHPVGPLPDSLTQASRTRAQAFLRESDRAQPLGFYTWTPALAAVFRQDRYLMKPLGSEEASKLARWLNEDPELGAAYQRLLQLAARMTNPPAEEHLSLQGESASGPRRVLPPSRSAEAELVTRLLSNRPVPADFDLARALAEEIASGRLSLAPRPDSGWNDQQVWALEPLVAPHRTREHEKLHLTEAYRAHLYEVFKGLLALTRETHVKQLLPVETGAASFGARKLYVSPELTAEPLATFYARRAVSYRFVRTVLEELFGAGWRTLRLPADRYATPGLEEALEGAEALFLGAHAAVCTDLGLDPDAGVLPDRHSALDEDTFRSWASVASRDPDLQRDTRMMVPVFFDVERRQMKVWALLGWSDRPMRIEFAQEPKVLSVEAPPPDRPILDRLLRRKLPEPTPVPEVQLCPTEHRVAFPVTAELYVRRTLDRDAFRALCDRHQTTSRILRALGAH